MQFAKGKILNSSIEFALSHAELFDDKDITLCKFKLREIAPGSFLVEKKDVREGQEDARCEINGRF